MLERSRKVSIQLAEVCHGKGKHLLLSYPAPCSSLGFATGTGLGQLMGFSPRCKRFCRWRDWEKRGHSWLAQVGVSNWERPVCCSRWSVAPGKCSWGGGFPEDCANSVPHRKAYRLCFSAQRGKTRDACGESVKSWETLVCLHSVSKWSRKNLWGKQFFPAFLSFTPLTAFACVLETEKPIGCCSGV